MLALMLVPSLVCYAIYGHHFFVPDSFTRLTHTPEEWQAMLRNRTVVFIGGPHRGGTSVLWEMLARHPAISAFGSTRETGSDHSEGMFVQSVYPRFGIGHEFNRGREGGKGGSAWRPTGLGRYALGPEADVHWTEEHPSVGAPKQAQLLNEFGRFWELSDKPVLLEKSPPNAVLSRYLQALLNVGNPGWAPVPPTFGGVQSVARFIFISRHPLANAYAHRAQGSCRDERLAVLIANWLAVHEYLEADAPRLQFVRRLRLEDLAASPHAAEEAIGALWAFLSLPPAPEMAAAAARSVRADPNGKYIAQHCESMRAEPRARAAFERAAAELNERVRAISVTGDAAGRYDLLDDDWRCAGLPPLADALEAQRAELEAAAALKDEN